MLEVKNRTPFNIELIPGYDTENNHYATVLIKGTFDLASGESYLPVSEKQSPVIKADEYYGDPENSSVKYESDLAMFKKRTDVILNGFAYAKEGNNACAVDVSLEIENIKKTVRVFGNRYWEKNNLAWEMTTPEIFDRIPLIYENAYGGVDLQALANSTDNNKEVQPYCLYNPIGKGYIGEKSDPVDGMILPNIENPTSLIQHWNHRPMPDGFGVLGRTWQPRIQYAGTYDEQWEATIMPLLPTDFSTRYFSAAHPSLQIDPYLSGGEAIIVSNATPSGLLAFNLPHCEFKILASIKGVQSRYAAILDTVVIEVENEQVDISWRALIPCTRELLYLEYVLVDWDYIS